jgi:hypothetical protein
MSLSLRKVSVNVKACIVRVLSLHHVSIVYYIMSYIHSFNSNSLSSDGRQSSIGSTKIRSILPPSYSIRILFTRLIVLLYKMIRNVIFHRHQDMLHIHNNLQILVNLVFFSIFCFCMMLARRTVDREFIPKYRNI